VNFVTLPEVGLMAVWDAGQPNKERIAMRFLFPVNLGPYALVCGPRTPMGSVLVSSAHFLKLPDREVAGATWVVVYTGNGIDRDSTMLGSGEPAIVLHWGQKKTLFGASGWAPALLEVSGIRLPDG